MPISSNLSGDPYVPTPVADRFYGPNTVSGSVSSQSPPPRFDQKSARIKNKNSNRFKEIGSKTKWSRKKKIIVGLIIAAVIIALIVAGVLLGVFLSRSSGTTTTTTTQATSVVTAYWTFDAVVNDYYGVYNGTLMNSAGYLATSNTQPYVGYGRGLSLTSSSSQYFLVSSPFLNLSYKSFTIEGWIYPTISTTSDFGIFGTYQCAICTNQGFYFIIRNYRLFVSFTNNDLSGNTTLTTNTWYHIAFVYNYATQQQILYINGVQDAIKSNAVAYQGANGTLLIGASQVFLATAYFNGYIDNFKITTRAKSTSEILTAATLTAYFSLDLPNPTYDGGPLGLNATASNIAAVSGRVNGALRFTGSSSYIYAYGFYQMGYGVTTNKPFSVALWISPSVAINCAIVQFAASLSGGCHNLIGLFTTLSVTSQILVQGYAWPIIYGPVAPLNTWTHLTVTYSFGSGLTLYVNGILIGNTGSFLFYSGYYWITYLQIGYYSSCSSAYINNNPYQGSVDEVYVYSRELAQSEATALANP